MQRSLRVFIEPADRIVAEPEHRAFFMYVLHLAARHLEGHLVAVGAEFIEQAIEALRCQFVLMIPGNE